jgi:hypothetical protein
MNIRDLINDLEQYPDDYVAVVSKDKDGNYVVVAIDPMKYYRDGQARTIDEVVSDRRTNERGNSGKQKSVRT